jgi:hypothetical protein
MGDGQDVVHLALFLASDEARYISGIVNRCEKSPAPHVQAITAAEEPSATKRSSGAPVIRLDQ